MLSPQRPEPPCGDARRSEERLWMPFFCAEAQDGASKSHTRSGVRPETDQVQRNGGGIAILTEDRYEEPELWRILWRALLASAGPQDHESAGLEPCQEIPGASAVKLTTSVNHARDH